MVILGIDPGSRRTGYGVIERGASGGLRLLTHGVISPSAKADLPQRIWTIFQGVTAIVAEHRPDVMAIEDVFHAVNSRTAIVLGHVRGAILVAASQSGVSIRAYPPARVKNTLTGYGQADKQQVAHMVAVHLSQSQASPPGDAADALALAICHAQHVATARLLSGARA